MKLVLSLILCIAMAVSGTGSLGPQPQYSTEWTISNVVLSHGSETVVLEKEAVVRGAVSDELAQLQLHILNGDQIMLPMAMEVSADEILLSFGSGKRAYSFANDMVLELGELTGEEDLQMIEYGSAFMLDLGRVLGRLGDAQFRTAAEAWLDQYNAQFYGEPVAAEVEIDGVIYQGEKRSGAYDDLDVARGVLQNQNSGIPEVDALLVSMMNMLCVMEGVDVQKGFDGLMERYQADELILTTEEITTVEQDGLRYSCTTSSSVDEENKIERIETVEEITRPDSRQMRLVSSEAVDKDVTAIELEITVNGPEEAPTSFAGSAAILQFADNSRAVKFSQTEETYLSTEETITQVEMRGECTDGLWTIAVDVQGETIWEYGSEDDKLRDVESFEMYFTSTEKAAGDGKTLCSYSMKMPVAGELFSLSFDVTSQQLPYEDPFAGLESYAIDLEDEDSPAIMMIAADAMALSGSAMLLNAQDDVFAASQLLEGLNYYGDYFEVQSVEEAKAHFEAPIPAFTPPTGYALDMIEVARDGSCVDFYYWSAAEEESILVSYYDFRGQARYHGLDEAALEKGPIVQTEMENGIVYTIDIFTPDVNVYIVTDGIRREEMDDLLDGLDVASLYMDEEARAALEQAGRNAL